MKTLNELEDFLKEREMEGTSYFTNPDYVEAIEGITDDGRLIYDYEKMVHCLVEDDGMEYWEAADFIDYNTIRTIPYMGDSSPIILFERL